MSRGDRTRLMATRTIEVASVTTASPEEVWALLSDITSWPRWGLWEEARVETPGAQEPQGLGTIRYMQADRMKTTEEIYIYEPPHHLAWLQLKTNAPVRNYRSDVQLTPIPDGGTQINWRASYESKIFGVGWMLDRSFKLFLADSARRLALAAAGRDDEIEDD